MADPAPSQARVAAALRRVVADLARLEALLAGLRRNDGSDLAVVEAAVAVHMAAGALAPTAQAWPGETEPATIDLVGQTGRLLRTRLAGGGAHLTTQAGPGRWHCRPPSWPSCSGPTTPRWPGAASDGC